MLFHDKVQLRAENDWDALFARNDLTFVTVIERHGRTNGAGVAHGLLKDFGLKSGAVASSVGHDSHNLIVAGTNERDMQVALDADHRGAGRRLRGGSRARSLPWCRCPSPGFSRTSA